MNKNPVLKNEDKHFISRDKYYIRSLEKMKRLFQIKKQHDIDGEDWIFLMQSTGEPMLPILVTRINFFIFFLLLFVVYYEMRNIFFYTNNVA